MDVNQDTFHKEVIKKAGKRILYTPHALKQMDSEKRMITTDDVIEVIIKGQIIEDYPEDKRGHSCLFNAKISNRYIHVVCAPKDAYLAIITAYIPDKTRWNKDYTKRKK